MEPSYILAFTAGLAGGAHCVGMCGPIVASYSLHGKSSDTTALLSEKIIPHIFYNTGRVITYAFIGALSGLTGSFVNSVSGLQNVTALIAGLVMIIMGISIAGLSRGTGWLERHNIMLMKTGQELLRLHSLWKYYILGSLMGFLPCGLSYSAFMAAAGTGSPVSGMLLSLLFGAGTVLWLLPFGIAASYVSARIKGIIYRGAGVIVIIMGIYFLLTGVSHHG
jgi:sulfite exporter TauE/SafE